MGRRFVYQCERESNVLATSSNKPSVKSLLSCNYQINLDAWVRVGKELHHLPTFLDTGCSSVGFLDTDTAHRLRLPIYELDEKNYMTNFENLGPSRNNILSHYTLVTLIVRGHEEVLPLYLTKLSSEPLFLGLPWLDLHGIIDNHAKQQLTFDSPFCREHCGLSSPLHVPYRNDLPHEYCRRSRYPPALDLEAIDKYASSNQLSVVRPGKKPQPLPTKATVKKPSSPKTSGKVLTPTPSPPTPPNPPLRKIAMVGIAPFSRLAKKKGHRLFTVSLKELEQICNPDEQLSTNQDEPEDVPWERLPKELEAYKDVFSKKAAKILPPHRKYDHQINLKPGTEPPFGPLYSCSQKEAKELKTWLQENLQTGFIRASHSPAASPVLFVEKPNGDLRVCVDYRGLNELTIKSKYPLPLIQETLDKLSKAVIYSKLDIISAFNRLRVQEGDEWKTAFRTRYGLYESLVMPFGLCNGPSSFQHYINDVLREFLDDFCTAYLDDILIFSNNKEDHWKHLTTILDRLREAGLQVDLKKCEFCVTEVKYLGMIITTKGIKMDPAKVATIVNWPQLKGIKDVQAFLGLANFYRRFIRGFSRLARPLTNLTRKNTPFNWNEKCMKAFSQLKTMFTTAPVLAHYDPRLQSVVEVDASDYCVSGILSQFGEDGILRPVAFFSHKLEPAQCNYEIYDKELLAVITAFKAWRSELEGSELPVKVVSDHKNLQCFMSTKDLSRRQARWAEFMSRFRFTLDYRPGRQGTKPDSLTRRSGDLPEKGGNDPRLQYQQQTIFKHEHTQNLCPEDKPDPRVSSPLTRPVFAIQSVPISVDPVTTSPDFVDEPIMTPPESDEEPENTSLQDLWTQAYRDDDWYHEIKEAFKAPGTNRRRDLELSALSAAPDEPDVLLYHGKKLVPESEELRIRLMQSCHELPESGHCGIEQSASLLRRNYWWPGIHASVKEFVKGCLSCKRSKHLLERQNGWLKPLPVPERRWQDLSLDFIVDLPKSRVFDQGPPCSNILVVVDRLSKMKHFVAMPDITVESTARAFIDRVYSLHGFPSTLVSDRGTQFISDFWKQLCQRLKTVARLSTAHHPETDGQTENANKNLEIYLRHFTNYLQNDWASYLPIAEFAANNSQSASTGCTPFFACYGQHPRMSFEDPALPSPTSARQRLNQEAANQFADKMSQISQECQIMLQFAQQEQAEQANRHRTPHHRYQVGSEVMLSTKFLNIDRPSKKLSRIYDGPFIVTHCPGTHTYELALPPTYHCHPVFHASRLRPAPAFSFACQRPPDPHPPIVANDGEQEWEVLEILDSRTRYRRVEYLILWQTHETTWERWDFLTNVDELLTDFHVKNPHRPGPAPSVNLGLTGARP